MQKQTAENSDVPKEEANEVPVCIHCFQPVDPLAHYCPNCGAATGQFTHYLPFINIRWQASVWGQAWRQIWYRDVSIPGRLFRLFMIVWNVPIMLIGVLFRSSRGRETEDHERDKAQDGMVTEMVRREDDLTRQESQENVLKIALAWFRREQWDRLLEVSEDRDELEETFDEWVQVAQQRYDELSSSGYDIKKIDVDVEELVRWCLAQDRPVDSDARSEFAIDKLKERT